MQNAYDLVVVGSGPGGTRAAFTSAAAGLKTAVVEAGFLGGTCLNSGCIPTKFLLGGTNFLPLLRTQAKFGTIQCEPQVDFAALQARKERFLKGSRQALEKRLAGAGITLVHGRAAFSGERELTVKGTDSTVLTFEKCILAVGSTPSSIPGLKPDGAAVLAPASVLNLKEAPESLIIVGAGPIGLELGDFFHRLGCAIQLVEGMPRVLPGEDEETGEFMGAYLARSGRQLFLGRKIAGLCTRDDKAELSFEDGEVIRASRAMVAVGRRPALNGLAVEAAGLAPVLGGRPETDEFLRLSPRIYAVGDVNGRMPLAGAADHQGEYSARHAAGLTDAPYAPPAMPLCIYGSMEVLRVGPTLRDLRSTACGELRVTRAAAAANSLAQATGHTQGFLQAVWENGVLRSVLAVCHEASHLGAAAALLVERKCRYGNLSPIVFAHPTLDESLKSLLEAPLEPAQL